MFKEGICNMIFKENIKIAEFINRPNRFQAYIKIDNKELMVHVPNTGRCKEILVPGCKVILREGITPNRKTPYDLIAAYKENRLINIDSQVPNKVVEEALINKKIDKLKKFSVITREKTYGNSRFDFKLTNKNEDIYYLEVKGVTLEDKGHTRFPDAPTERGAKHLLELVEIKEKGMGAGILFLIQMDDMSTFQVNKEMDEKFANALELARNSGVDIFAYGCKVGENYIELKNKLDIIWK